MAWTKQQQQAIDARNCNLLVSAAAGSGKTTVLVERIMQKLLDPEHPMDVDSLVIVTFTRAAASEMKEKLVSRLLKETAEHPSDTRLLKQVALVDHAMISTIDSFCAYVVHNYYNTLDLDPSLRPGEKAELDLLAQETFEALQEKYFAEKDPEFRDFANAFAPGKELDELFTYVLSLYRYAQSMPWPEEWLQSCAGLYEISSVEELVQSPLVQDTLSYIHRCCRDALAQNGRILELLDQNPALEKYRGSQSSDRRLLQAMAESESLEQMHQVMQAGFATLETIRGDIENKELVKQLRDEIKDRLRNIDKKYLSESYEEMLESIRRVRPHARMLVRLTQDFSRAYAEAKAERGISEFSDVAHWALQLLLQKDETGKIVRTGIAKELAERYSEIYIDEYQDSNYVQEAVLTAISRIEDGTPNIFMVGDVKQSIYRFRLARPELFNDKYIHYQTFTEDSAANGFYKIELGHNFRSCENVLHSINDIFYRVMQPEVGGIAYTDECRLNYGGVAQSAVAEDATEVLMVHEAPSDAEKHLSGTELCAHTAAKRIRELKEENPTLGWKDFVILLRSVSSHGPVYVDCLREHEIPAVCESSTGYFDTPELKDVTNYLRIIDNPRQDIPLAGVLRSFYAYFTAEELASVKSDRRRLSLYDCIRERAAEADELGGKCTAFLGQLEDYRQLNRIHPIRELLNALIYSSGYYDYVGLMPGGSIRKANLRLLVEKAEEFEKTSYSGLFYFLKYIEKLKTYDLDSEESEATQETEDAVRIMTIHKSKGLEFPVVLLGNADSAYNSKDTGKAIYQDDHYGVILNEVDTKRHVRRTPVVKNMLARHMNSQMVGEELRVLYVALTRAKSKLVVIGTVGDKNPGQYEWEGSRKPNADYMLEKRNYLALIAPTAYAMENKGRFEVEELGYEKILEYAAQSVATTRTLLFEDYVSRMKEAGKACDTDRIARIMEYRYPHEKVYLLKSKYSVSELKHAAMELLEEEGAAVVPPQEEKPIPYFMGYEDKSTNPGTVYGNAYHKFFELLDYECCTDAAACRDYAATLVEKGKLSAGYAQLLDPHKFETFLQSELGQAMKRAFLRKELFREQPFIMEVSGNEVAEGAPEEEKVLVQGIIDAFFYGEDGKVYLVDYKTDHVENENTLIDRYKKQLVLYEEALSLVTGRTIGGSYLYSVCLGCAIRL